MYCIVMGVTLVGVIRQCTAMGVTQVCVVHCTAMGVTQVCVVQCTVLLWLLCDILYCYGCYPCWCTMYCIVMGVTLVGVI